MINQALTFESISRRRRSRLRYLVPLAVACPLVLIGAFLALALTANADLKPGSSSLAELSLPLAGGSIERVAVVGAPQQSVVPVRLSGDQIWPADKLLPGQRLTITATVRRPSWIGWLVGSTERVTLTETAPVAKVASTFLTRQPGSPMTVRFTAPVDVVAYGAADTPLQRQVLRTPQRTLQVQETASAGTIAVAAAARTWERLQPTDVSWFPAGSHATAVAAPAPGSRIGPGTEITLTFSEPVAKVLRHHLPPVSPHTQGAWHRLNTHTIEFVPKGYGYGLGAHVAVSLPAGVHLLGVASSGSDPVGHWTVPAGSTLRLQQLLASLGYLPVDFSQSGKPVASTVAAQEQAAVDPPGGHFNWRYGHTPSTLRALWEPGSWGELTKGAVMAFEDTEGLPVDGVSGPAVWKALMKAEIKGRRSTFGYTFVHVSETLPESVKVWHDGKVVVSGPVNTGIPAAPTATGTYAVYEHIPVGTMSGTNPDGTTYDDPGIPWISYFNGGDALHGFIRGSYGFPQSLGCVEMPFAEAGEVYPYTPIGTIVDVVP